jgi:protein-disulfide isomerase
MNKIIPIVISAITVALIVGVVFPSYYAQVVEIQEFRDEKIAMKKANQNILNLDHVSPVLGSADAQITIVEFGDYQCEMCHSWFHNTRGAIIDNYVDTGKVNIVFVDLAFLGSDSPVAAQATHCANEQGKYWEYHSILYYKQEGIDNGWASKNMLKEYANELKLDSDQFAGCIDSAKYAKNVQDNYNLAVKLLEYPSTPTFYVFDHENGVVEKISGAQPLSVFVKTIDSML